MMLKKRKNKLILNSNYFIVIENIHVEGRKLLLNFNQLNIIENIHVKGKKHLQ